MRVHWNAEFAMRSEIGPAIALIPETLAVKEQRFSVGV
jgi:hypothetical protein